ncbi:MAG: ATP synthase subunit I [Proteobacteria bacterium]|nr:ATP synthase subunit I [Pseudomonadota bacterium]MBU1740452.1 ATP synthase subunit I [Pseudomonadota bacterium]
MRIEVSSEDESSRTLCRRISLKALGLTAVAAAVSLGLGYYPVALGLVLGAVVSVVNFWLMARMLPYRLNQSQARATAISYFGLLARYPLLAVPLIIGVLTPAVSFGAAAAGLFAVQLTILLDRIIPAGG